MESQSKKTKKEGYIASIMRRDPAARNRFAVFFLYPSCIAMRWYRFSHFCWLHHMKFLAEMAMHHANRVTGIEIHPGAKIGRNLFIDHGNGVVIENLLISNKYSELYDPPTDKDGKSLENSDGTLKDSNFVGAFGVIGNSDEKATSLAWDKNENIVKNAYFDSIDVHTASSKTLVGVVAGYAGGTMEKCGVHYSSIKVGSNVTNLDGYENVSKYSLLGEYNKAYQWTDAPGDVGYGNSLDLAEISARTSMLSTKDQFSKFEYLPLRGTGQKRSDAIKTPGGRTATYVGEQAAETNIGYITGSDVKISTDKTLFGNVVNDTFFSIKDSNGNFTGNQDEIYTTEIKKDDDIYLNTFGSEAFQNKKPIPLIRLMSRLEDFSVDETARVTYIKDAWISGNHYDQIIIPARSIWVKPVLPGTMRFIIVSCDGTHNILSLNKVVRQNPKDLTSRLTRTDAIPEQYLRLSYGGAVRKINGVDVKSGEYSRKYFVYSIQYDVTEQEVAAGTEFVLNNQSKSNGAYFWYMDVGQNGSQADFQGNITNVDFLAKDSNGFLIGFEQVDIDRLRKLRGNLGQGKG